MSQETWNRKDVGSGEETKIEMYGTESCAVEYSSNKADVL